VVFGARAEGFVRAAKNVVRNVQRHGSRPPTEAGLLHHSSTSAIRAKTHPATNPHIRPAESVTAIERSMAALMLRLITTLDFVTAIAECVFGSVLNQSTCPTN
jgi:hypothetical protein